MNKSRPIYEPLRVDHTGRAHLIVSDLTAIPPDCFAGGLPDANIETWLVKTIAPGIQAPETGAIRAFRAPADLLTHLAARLAREPVGLRLYAIGTEAFVWDAANTARAAGMGKDEVFLAQAGSLRRRVYCTHCKTMNEDVTTNITPCRACGAALFVRDHFSRRLAAFMGVMVDAEMPGEIPELEVLYP
jgi:hypothetical protein